jgi:hypothetical protein
MATISMATIYGGSNNGTWLSVATGRRDASSATAYAPSHAAGRIVDHFGHRWRCSLASGSAALIVDGTLVPTRDHMVAEQSENYRSATNHQVVIDADTRLDVAVGRPPPGNPMTARRGNCPEPSTPSAAPR